MPYLKLRIEVRTLLTAYTALHGLGIANLEPDNGNTQTGKELLIFAKTSKLSISYTIPETLIFLL